MADQGSRGYGFSICTEGKGDASKIVIRTADNYSDSEISLLSPNEFFEASSLILSNPRT
jgi:hypothetical protein